MVKPQLLLVICATTNDFCLVRGVVISDQLLLCPKEALADHLPNSCCRILLCNVTKSSKEDVADPIQTCQVACDGGSDPNFLSDTRQPSDLAHLNALPMAIQFGSAISLDSTLHA